MPIYTYVCQDCGEKFDLLLGVNQEKERLVCKKCGSKRIKKVLSGFSVGSSTKTTTWGGSCSTGTCPLS